MFQNSLHPTMRSGALLGALLAGAFIAASAEAQPIYSVDWHGPPKGTPSFFGIPITEGDLLCPTSTAVGPPFIPGLGPLPPVAIAVSGGFGPPAPGLALPLHPGAMGLGPGVMGFVELDAVSYGTDYPITGADTAADIIWTFSVDEFATSFAGSPIPPNVFTQGAAGALMGASAIYRDTFTGPGPVCAPLAATLGNTLLLDCNGLAPPAGAYPGIMGPPPFEFNPPGAGVPDPGADLDALEMDPPPGIGPMGTPGFAFPIFYSLDAGFFDIVEGVPNEGSAGANGGFFGGDVLVCMAPAIPPAMYAPGAMLGIPGPLNDLDALVLWENGIPGYQPPTVPYSWVPGVIVGPPTDMLFFSVRRSSAIIGVPDSMCGTPITPGDILWGPAIAGAPPRKWITSAQLALTPMDEVDALDLQSDCNSNNVPDNLEVLMGFAADINGNLIPDTCDCLADVNGDGTVNITDLLAVIAAWGALGGPADVNFNGIVNIADLLAVIAAWGPCP